ncbi:MAG: WG repeat-containing protein [Flavobacteriales bacterium]|nr:WG repeat-containing protein [Flavobacteriales bacterium]
MRLFATVITLLVALTVQAQEGRFIKKPLAVLCDGVYTFADRDSLQFIANAPEFEKVYSVPMKPFFVVKNTKFGLINNSLKSVLPLDYDTIYFSNNYRISKKGDSFQLLGAINKMYSVIADRLIDDGDQGWIIVKGQKQGYFDRETGVLIQPKYEAIRKLDKVLFVMNNGRFGLLKSDGSPLFDPIYSEVVQYNDSVFRARLGNQHVYSTLSGPAFKVDVQTKVIFTKFGYNKRMEVKDTLLYQTSTGYLIGNGSFENYFPLAVNRIAVKQGDSIYLRDENLNPVLKLGYQDIILSKSRNFIVKKGFKYGLVNEKDSVLLDFNYTYVSDYDYSGYDGEKLLGYLLYSNGKVGFADHNCRVIISPNNDGLSAKGYGMFIVNNGGGFGMYNLEGEKIVNANYHYYSMMYPKLIRFELNKRFIYTTPKAVIASMKNRNYLGNDVLKSYLEKELKVYEFDSSGAIIDQYSYPRIPSVSVVRPPPKSKEEARKPMPNIRNRNHHTHLHMIRGKYGVFNRLKGTWNVPPVYDFVIGRHGLIFDSSFYQVDSLQLYSEFTVDIIPANVYSKTYHPSEITNDMNGANCGSMGRARLAQNGSWRGSKKYMKDNLTYLKGCSENKVIYYKGGKLIFTDRDPEQSATIFFDRFNGAYSLRPANAYSAERIIRGDKGIKPIGGNWFIYHEPYRSIDEQYFNGKYDQLRTDLFVGHKALFHNGPYIGHLNYSSSVLIPAIYLRLDETPSNNALEGERLVDRYNYINIHNEDALFDTLFNLKEYDGRTLIVTSKGQKGIVNKTLDTLVAPKYNKMKRLGINRFKVSKGSHNQLAIIDTTGQFITGAGYLNTELESGVIMSVKSDTMEFYNAAGMLFLRRMADYEFLQEKDGYFQFEYEDKIKYYNPLGALVYTHSIATRVKLFRAGFLEVKKKRGVRVYNLNIGRYVKGTSDKNAKQTATGQLILRNGKGHYIVSNTGERKKNGVKRLIPLENGLFFVKRKSGWFLMNEVGDTLVFVGSQEYEDFGEVMRITTVENDMVFYNVRDQRICTNQNYQLIQPIVNGHGWAYDLESRKKVLVNRDLELICDIQFDEVKFSNSELFAFRRDRLWGVANTKGEVLIEPKYWGIQPSGLKDWWRIQDFPRSGVVSSNNSTIIPFIYERVNWYDGYLFQVEKDGKIGYVKVMSRNTDVNKIIWPLQD